MKKYGDSIHLVVKKLYPAFDWNAAQFKPDTTSSELVTCKFYSFVMILALAWGY